MADTSTEGAPERDEGALQGTQQTTSTRCCGELRQGRTVLSAEMASAAIDAQSASKPILFARLQPRPTRKSLKPTGLAHHSQRALCCAEERSDSASRDRLQKPELAVHSLFAQPRHQSDRLQRREGPTPLSKQKERTEYGVISNGAGQHAPLQERLCGLAACHRSSAKRAPDTSNKHATATDEEAGERSRVACLCAERLNAQRILDVLPRARYGQPASRLQHKESEYSLQDARASSTCDIANVMVNPCAPFAALVAVSFGAAEPTEPRMTRSSHTDC